jgi:hypothetical protein
MKKQVGIRLGGVPSLGELLYFDVIVIAPLGQPNMLNTEISDQLTEHGVSTASIKNLKIEQQQRNEEQSARIDYLEENGIIVDISSFFTLPIARRSFESATDLVSDKFSRIIQIVDESTSNIPIVRSTADEERHNHLVSRVQRGIDQLLVLPYRRTVEAHPDYEPTSILDDLHVASHGGFDCPIVELVIKRLPTPSADVPLEAVLDFRSDPEAVQSLRRLQRWMRSIATKNLSPREVDDQLDDLIDQYATHMRLHKMKYQNSWLRTFITIPLDSLDNVMRLRFKPAFETLFTLRDQKIALTEEEIKTPGREVAYIVQAQEAFPGNCGGWT